MIDVHVDKRYHTEMKEKTKLGVDASESMRGMLTQRNQT
jgi:hypothetical protein